MKVFYAKQINAWDRFTMEQTPIASIDLMERAALAFVNELLHLYRGEHFLIFCGNGDNGGDGLAIARLLYQRNIAVEVWLLKDKALSADAQINYHRLV
jgi:hydroxyethylthiazole kinase-like uncharacterized protein yjeF